jgi:hypothetical protein
LRLIAPPATEKKGRVMDPLRPTDLTILARQKAGKFPSMQVAKAITGEAGISAHGSKDMPIWGPVFMSMSHQHESVVHLRVANLTEYIKSLQQK